MFHQTSYSGPCKVHFHLKMCRLHWLLELSVRVKVSFFLGRIMLLVIHKDCFTAAGSVVILYDHGEYSVNPTTSILSLNMYIVITFDREVSICATGDPFVFKRPAFRCVRWTMFG